MSRTSHGSRRSVPRSASEGSLAPFPATPSAASRAGKGKEGLLGGCPPGDRGDHTLGYRGPRPHFSSTYSDWGKSAALDPPLEHRPVSEHGVPDKHHFLSMPVYAPRVSQGQKTLLEERDARHTTLRPVRPEPARMEGDFTTGLRGLEAPMTQLSHGRVGYQHSEWGAADKHHHMAMPCFPSLVHKSSVPDTPKKQEGDMSRGLAGPRPHMWSTSWDLGNARGCESYDFTPIAEKHYRFATATERG